MRPGLGSVHLLQGKLAAPMTNEQRLRGADGGVDRALLVTGYRQDAVAALAAAELDGRRLEAEGAAGATVALYRTDYTLVAADVGSPRPARPAGGSAHEGELRSRVERSASKTRSPSMASLSARTVPVALALALMSSASVAEDRPNTTLVQKSKSSAVTPSAAQKSRAQTPAR